MPQAVPKSATPAITLPERRIILPVQGGALVRVKSIRFVGGEGWVREDDLTELVRPVLGQSLSNADLLALTERVISTLKSRGWLLAQAYLPPQDVTDGDIEFQLMPGLLDGGLEGIVVNGAQRVSAQRIRAMVAEPMQGQQGRLNTQQLEEGLLRAAELSGVKATASLERGAQPGSSRLTIEAKEAPRAGGGLTLDNFGGSYTGEQRTSGSLTLNSPLGLGDSLLLNAVASSGIEMLTTQLSLPVGHSGMKLGASLSSLHYRVGGDLSDLGLQGRALMSGLSVSYPWVLTPTFKLRARLGFDHKTFVDTALGERIGDKVAQVVSLGLSGQINDGLWGGGLNDWSLGLDRGHMNLSRLPDVLAQDQAGPRSHGHFQKWLYSFARLQPLAGQAMLQFSLNGQQARNNLESSEKFSLGGNNAIRAYPGGEAAGDNGMVASLTVSHPLSWPQTAQRLELSGFYDWGRIRAHHSRDQVIDSATGLNSYNLSGAGLALNLSKPGAWNLAMTWAHTLGDNPGRSTTGNNSDGKASRNRLLLALKVEL
jgi:hemolysin activation/secretion protein